MREATILVHAGRDPRAETVNPPLERASTILSPSMEELDHRNQARARFEETAPDYGIHGLAQHRAFYRALCALEGPQAVGAWAFGSGLAGVVVPILGLVKAGDHALFPDNVYDPTRHFAENFLKRMGVAVSFYAPNEGETIEKRFRPETKLVVMESPGSHTFEMTDVPAVARACRRHDVFSLVDNTWATPLFFKPLNHGVDVVVHAATKYISGHSDVLMGVCVCNQATWPLVRAAIDDLGQAAGPEDVYLAYRGLHTMRARMQVQTESAWKIVHWLQIQPQVERVLWPALPEDPGYAIWSRDYTGVAPLFGVVFRQDCQGKMAAFCDRLRLFGRGYSWGGFESLCIPSYGMRGAPSLPFSRMVRISVGLEDSQDLIDDLSQAFAALA